MTGMMGLSEEQEISQGTAFPEKQIFQRPAAGAPEAGRMQEKGQEAAG